MRGPQSALYGSDAITLVVQPFTRRGGGAARLGFAGGSFETFEEHGGISGGTERYGYSLDVGRIDSDGILAVNNRYGNTTVASRFDWSPFETLDVAFAERRSSVVSLRNEPKLTPGSKGSSKLRSSR